MATIIVNWFSLSAPIDSPMVATITSVEPRAFMPQASASDSRRVRPPISPPMNAPANFPTLAITINPSAISASCGSRRTVRSVDRPAMPKNTGMKKARIRPRSCSSMCLLRIGDSPISTPATNAPSTVWTPMKCVVSAMAPMITRMVVITGKSLSKLSFAHRIRKKTKRRPTVKLAIRNAAVPSTLLLTLMRSMLPASARLNVIAMMIQPIESSQIAEATMICPRLRRVKPISRTIAATILMDEIESAVPRNSDVRKRWSGCGSSDSGMNWPSAKPQANGTATPVSEMLSAALPTLRTSRRSVSIPVSKSNSRMPNCEMPSSMAFCSGVLGKSACCRSGSSAPSAEGPSRIPPSNIPMIEG